MDLPEKLVSWLQDAHAIELHVEKTLHSYDRLAHPYPELSGRIRQHIADTRVHAEKVEKCLKSLGRAPSGFEALVARVLGVGQTAAASLLGDAVLTGCAAAYAMEHLEVATYTGIIAAAKEASQPEIVQACREIMAEDAAMGAWLLEQLPALTRKYLDQSSGYGAKS